MECRQWHEVAKKFNIKKKRISSSLNRKIEPKCPLRRKTICQEMKWERKIYPLAEHFVFQDEQTMVGFIKKNKVFAFRACH